MSKMIGSTDVTGKIVTLTTGSLSTWVASGASVFGYTGATYGTQVISNNPIASVTSSTVFNLTNAVTANTTGIKIIISAEYLGAEYALKQNCATIPPVSGTLSQGAGYFGSDGVVSIDLTNAGLSDVLWVFADTFWATSAQARSACTFMHNCVALQTGGNYNINYTTAGSPASGSDTLTFYGPTSGTTSPTEVFPYLFPSTYQWPQGGYCFNSYVTMINAIPIINGNGLTVTNENMLWINNIKTGSSPTAPSSWSITVLPTPIPEGFPGSTDVHNWLVPGDGYVYIMGICAGQTLLGRNIYLSRFPSANMIITTGTPNFNNMQYWTYSGWVSVDILQTDEFYLSKLKPIITEGSKYDITLDNNGSLFQKSDSSYVFTNVPYYGLFEIGAFTSTSMTSGWSAFQQFWLDSGGSGAQIYNCVVHKEQVFAGQGTDDFLYSYNTNNTASFSNGSTYWSKFITVSGI